VVDTQILTPRGRRPALAFGNGETLSKCVRLKTGKTMIERGENFVIPRRKKPIGRVPAHSVKKRLAEVRRQVLVGRKGRGKGRGKGCGKGRGKGCGIHLDEEQHQEFLYKFLVRSGGEISMKVQSFTYFPT
jgi:hypothetical protein